MRALDPVILGFLRYGPASGYDLKEQVDRSVGHFWTVSYGGLYPALHRLVEDGLVVLEAEEGRRKVYGLTPKGRGAFEDWLQTSYSGSVVKDGFLLRLFFSTEQELAGLRPQLQRRVAELTETQAELRRVAGEVERGAVRLMGPGQRAALELGLATVAAELQQVEALLVEAGSKSSAEEGSHG